MPKTSSLSFPNMFNVAQNKVEVLVDEKAVTNRCRLLILTEPTEIYNEPRQGVGLKRYLFQYNNENTRQMLKDRIVEQLRVYEPQCNADGTQFSDGLLFSGNSDDDIVQKNNKLEMTVSIETVFGADAELTI